MLAMDAQELFQELRGSDQNGFAAVHAPVSHTDQGTPYLQEPGVVVLARPQTNLAGLSGFLEGFESRLRFPEYVQDATPLPEGAQLCKVAGQLCYMSFGPKRSFNEQALRYFDNLKSSGHGSVLEHACFSLLCYGISRSVTHELIRHRAGFSFSQTSQRFVSGRMLRFVERVEYRADEQLHAQFLRRIDRAAEEYAALTERLLEMQEAGVSILSAEARTDLRKKVRQTARSVLPNETEAPIVVTANARAWRHFVEMRANAHAETEIRALALRAFLCLVRMDPVLFSDYTLEALPDGTYAVHTDFRKA
ncbi:MAG: FAD-dependent thymidylate synthase [Ktedonobacteraceae bacterium]|nr:FAD-dependent thymidylate synthase [Ktedonobacteraceae bacterium]MBO0793164.1 FAD-dependent thymidylate synthase [Ktedonobacteraceae bacterium]